MLDIFTADYLCKKIIFNTVEIGKVTNLVATQVLLPVQKKLLNVRRSAATHLH